MAPNSSEFRFAAGQSSVRDNGRRAGQDPEEHDHFARSFRDQLSAPAFVREIDLLGLPDLVIDRAVDFVPEVAVDALPPHFNRGRGLEFRWDPAPRFVGRGWFLNPDPRPVGRGRFLNPEPRPVGRGAVAREPRIITAVRPVSPLLQAMREWNRGRGAGRGSGGR